MSKRAIILAGGKGQRLRPYTVVLPKPLMPVGEYPIMEVLIRQLGYYGFDHITLAVNHQADIIKAFFGDGSRWGIKVDYSLEEEALSTMGPLKLIHGLPENFLVLNGDILSDIDFNELHEAHVKSEHVFTISSYCREQKIDYGVLETSESGILCGFTEKPSLPVEVSMGIYVVNKSILDFIPHREKYGFDNLMLELLKQEIPVHTKRFNGYWLDIGRADDYMQAIEEFETMKERFIKT